MTKLEMAHEFAMKLAELKVTNKTEDIIRLGWEYADAMQAEADKRSDMERPAVLQDEWQPDWSVAPEWADYWCMQAHSGWCYWTESQPTKKWDQFGIIKNELAPSFGYQGSWENSLRKRP